MTTNTTTTTASQPNAAPSVQSDAVKSLAARLVAAGVTRFSFTRGTDESATPERIAQAINYALDQIEARNADLACDVCNGTGQVCVGTSGQESDGNGPVMEACPECAYFDAAAPALPEPASALDNTAIRKILHKYSRHMGQSGYYSDTEFACLQDVIAFAKEIAALASASPQPLAEVSAAQAVPELTEAEILESLNTLSHEPPKRLPPGWINFARSIERKVQAKFAQSTDTTREA